MKNILVEQNRHWSEQVSHGIKRDALDKLVSFLPLRQIITITGIRRCGKSTLARQAIDYLINNNVPPENIFFINLENPSFLEHRQNPGYLDTIYEEYLKLVNPKGRVYYVLDEIQYFDNWQVYIKNKYEYSDVKFIITGSNSSLLSNELNTMLSGRSLNIHLNTFSFREFLRYKNIDYDTELDFIKNRIDIYRAKDEYLKWGGFYEVFDIADEAIKKEILISYAKNIIYQDIVPKYNIRNSEIVERLFYYLLVNITSIVNYTGIADTFGVSGKSIREYINYFEDVFMFKRVDRFHTKSKERIKSPKKIYLLDNGFLQIAPSGTRNLGAMLENAVFTILNRKADEVTYVKENFEIDFLCNNSLYQVSYSLDDDRTRNRELRAFTNFDKNSRYRHRLICHDDCEVIDGTEVIKYEDFALGRC